MTLQLRTKKHPPTKTVKRFLRSGGCSPKGHAVMHGARLGLLNNQGGNIHHGEWDRRRWRLSATSFFREFSRKEWNKKPHRYQLGRPMRKGGDRMKKWQLLH